MSIRIKSPTANQVLNATRIRAGSLRLARIASPLVNESITDFVSKASDVRAMRVIKEFGVRLPKDVVPCS